MHSHGPWRGKGIPLLLRRLVGLVAITFGSLGVVGVSHSDGLLRVRYLLILLCYESKGM